MLFIVAFPPVRQEGCLDQRLLLGYFLKKSPETIYGSPLITSASFLEVECELGVNRTSCTAIMRALHHSRNVTCLDAGHYYTSLKVLFETNLPLFANLNAPSAEEQRKCTKKTAQRKKENTKPSAVKQQKKR